LRKELSEAEEYLLYQERKVASNIIFLDMDGVLCTPRACIAAGNKGCWSYLDPIACLLLRRLCEDFDARLVISSTWRLGDINHLSFASILNAACPNLGTYVLRSDQEWRTPQFLEHYPDPDNRRGSEIRDWLKRNDLITKMFIILDDDSDISPYENFHVKCDVYDGLTFQAYIKARSLLGDS
jgi:hypothetical protein